MHYIEEFRDGDNISDVYLCKSKTQALTKSGKEYDNVLLIDKTGVVDAKIWDPSSGGIGDFDAYDYVFVSGQVSLYNGSLQLKISRIRKADESEYIAADYVPSTKYSVEDMYTKLLGYINKIQNKYIKQLLNSFFVEDKEFINKFKKVSAAKTVHHGFAGGLLEHSLSVTSICEFMSQRYDYINKDLLMACAMLHDVGKVKELSEFPKNDYTDEGNYIGHIVMGYQMVCEKIAAIEGFPQGLSSQIGHCILSHHGELEYGSPKKPSIVEALALSLADNMDAKMETMKEALDAKESNDWLGYNKWLDCNIKKTII